MPSLQLELVLYTNPAACLDYRSGQNQEIVKTSKMREDCSS